MLWWLIASLLAAAFAGGYAWRLRRRCRDLGRSLEELQESEPLRALRESEAKLSAAQKLAQLGYWEWDPAADRLWWSAVEYEVLGYARSTRPSLDAFFARVHPADRERLRAAMRRLVASPADADIEFRILHPELGERHIFSRTQVITDGAGRAIRLIGTEQDLTDLRQAQAALGESEQRYRAMFDSAPVALWEQDYSRVFSALDAVLADGEPPRAYFDSHPDFVAACARRARVLNVNKAAVALSGARSKNDLLGPLDRQLQPESLGAFKEQLVAIAERRSHVSTEMLLPNVSGRRLHIRVEARLPHNLEEAKRVLVSTTDITATKDGEAERERLIAELEAKNAELERFTYTVSHDLRSPLVTITGFVDCIERDVAASDGEQLRHDVERIRKAANHMRRLLSELLQLSRLGRVAEPAKWIDLAEIVEQATDRVAGALRDGSVELAVEPRLPAVFGDRLRLIEVVQNLLENAVRFMGRQPKPRIEIGTREEDGNTVFYVHDNGIGIPRQHHERIFGLFERLDPTTDGTGIGLALVRRIVAVHGGRTWVESEGEGRGATFCLTLGAQPVGAEAAPGKGGST